MSKKIIKQKPLFNLHLRNTKIAITKQKLELVTLITLVTLVIVAQVSGLYPYVYNYAKCKDAPLEVRGKYYKTPYDENYGIHAGSDYSHCYPGPLPKDLQRDPSTKLAKRIADAKEKRDARIASSIVYKPEGYELSSYRQSDNGDRLETYFTIKTDSGTKFDVSEIKKGSSYDYTGICYKPPIENWSGTIIGKDTHGREICKTNLSKYVTLYTVGIYIDDTAIVLRAQNGIEANLNDEVSKIFSSMKSS